MRIKVYALDFETPRWLRRTLAYALPFALVCGVGVVYASVPHTFTAGETLTAADLNANFVALDGRIDGPLVMSESSGPFATQSDTPVPLPNSTVTLDTNGGLVRLELAPDATAGAQGTGGRVWVVGAGGGADPWLVGYVAFERSQDGVTWNEVKTLVFGGAPSAVGSTLLPPGAFTHYDSPPPGTWSYRVQVYRKSNAGDLTVNVDNVRLVARELGATP
ncbi:MAG: hypothetical protein HY908_21600 [Myxococcales bacterium]|nr:hypothetical protein [Myxococcales bacterium]